MDRYEVGMLARSKAGHDNGRVYVILEVDEAYVYLIDGCSILTMSRPKKKKKKHVQIIYKKHDLSGIDDVGVKRILKLYNKQL